jgi:hypothetical protein
VCDSLNFIRFGLSRTGTNQPDPKMFFGEYGPRGDTKLIKIDHCTSHPSSPRSPPFAAAGRYRWRTRLADSLAGISTPGSNLPGLQGGQERFDLWGGIYLVQFRIAWENHMQQSRTFLDTECSSFIGSPGHPSQKRPHP